MKELIMFLFILLAFGIVGGMEEEQAESYNYYMNAMGYDN